MDVATWKLADLEMIMKNEMAIRERPDQPVRVSFMVMLKGQVVFSRSYDDSDTKPGGKLAKLFDNISGMGDQYSINHQRMIQFGAVLYEQPSEIGMPLAYIDSMTFSAHLKATVKRGNQRGLIYRLVISFQNNYNYKCSYFL